VHPPFRTIAIVRLSGCASIVGTGPIPDQILVSPSAVNLAPGQTQQLSVSVVDSAGQPLPEATVNEGGWVDVIQ
jgi:hypothetical protein